MKIYGLFFSSILLLISNSSFARGFYSGAQSLSFADSGRAGLESAEAALINPSLLGLNQSEAFLTYADGAPSDASHTTNFGVTLVDAGAQNISPGALSYRKLRRVGEGLASPADGELWHGALGKLVSPRWSLGFSVYRLSYEVSGVEVPDQWNGSIGVTYLVSSNLGVAYVLDSPFEVSEDVPVPLREETAHSVGLFYKPVENSRFRVDLSKKEEQNPSDNLDLSTSFEMKTSEFFVMRFGHKWEGSTSQNRVGAGFGFIGPRLKVDYGFQQNLKDSTSMHGVDLRIGF